MRVYFHRNFEKQYKKLSKTEKQRVQKRLSLFIGDEFDPSLNNHPLLGAYNDYRSINITGNLRAIYKFQNPDIRIFIAVDSHSNLYK